MEDIHQRLALYGQEHLLQFWDTLTDYQRNELSKDIGAIDFETVISDFQKAMASSEKKKQQEANRSVKPTPESSYRDVSKITSQELKYYEQQGLKMISESKVAVLVLAGGQGTRLGVCFPKGNSFKLI